MPLAATPLAGPPGRYVRHHPETTLLHQLIAEHWPALRPELAAADRSRPALMGQEFDAFLTCGILEHGAMRVCCDACHLERLVAFSCKRRGFCPSCGGRRMAETAALLTDQALPAVPLCQWVLSLSAPVRRGPPASGTARREWVSGRGFESTVFGALHVVLQRIWTTCVVTRTASRAAITYPRSIQLTRCLFAE